MLVDDALFNDVIDFGEDIVVSERFSMALDVHHHSRNDSIAVHSLETAGYALLLTRWLNQHGASVSESDAVRASLLHDIGMTEEKVFLSPSYKKASSHPREGARIAKDEFGANETQVDAILYHMWPFCSLVAPRSTVGFVVTVADKLCSLNELRCRLKRTISV